MPRSKSTSPRKRPTQIRNYLFHNHIMAILEDHGWTRTEKKRPQKFAEDGSLLPQSGHIDRYFLPPGVTHSPPFRSRRDYFDSRVQVLSALKSHPDKYGEELSSYVLRFEDASEAILKREKKGEFRDLEVAEGRDSIKRAERIMAISAEEALLGAVEDNLQHLPRSECHRVTADLLEGDQEFIFEEMPRLPKYIGETSIPIFTSDVINSDILGRVPANSSNDGTPPPEVSVTDVPDDPRLVDLHLAAQKDLMDELKSAVLDVINKMKDKYEGEQSTNCTQIPDVSPEKNTKEKVSISNCVTKKRDNKKSTKCTKTSNVSAEKNTKENAKKRVRGTSSATDREDDKQDAQCQKASNVPAKNNKKRKASDTTDHATHGKDSSSIAEKPGETLTNKTTKQVDATPGTNFITVTKKLPKFIGSTDRVLLTDAKVDSKVVQKIFFETKLKQESVILHTGDKFPLLEASISDIPSHPDSVQLLVRGRADLVQMVQDKICNWINKETIQYNLQKLLQDGSNLEIDLYFDIGPDSTPIMEDIVDAAEFLDHVEAGIAAKRNQEGLWIRSELRPESQLKSVIGHAAIHGAALLMVDGNKVSSSADLKKTWEKVVKDAVSAKKMVEGGKSDCHGEPSFDPCKNVVVTICVGKNADLGSIDTSRVVRNEVNPRRLDGAVYNGKHKFGSFCASSQKVKAITSTPKTSNVIIDPMVSDPLLASKKSSTLKTTTETGSKHDNFTLSRRILSRKTNSGMSSSSLHKQREFSVTFDPCTPLGFYCITEQKKPPASGSVCKITSVNLNAQRRDAKIQPGTIIVASSLVKSTVTIRGKSYLCTHTELKKRYDHAKMRTGLTKLRLWFINTDVVPTTTGDSTITTTAGTNQISKNNGWTKGGIWQGKSNVLGWAGGAVTIEKIGNTAPSLPEDKQPKQLHQMYIRKSCNTTTDQGRIQSQKSPVEEKQHAEGSLTGKCSISSEFEHIDVDKNRVTSEEQDMPSSKSMHGRETASKGTLSVTARAESPENPTLIMGPLSSLPKKIGSIKPQESRKVCFPDNIKETKYFNPIEPALLVGNKRGGDVSTLSPAFESAATAANEDKKQRIINNHKLTQAILHKGYKKVVQLLKAGEYENLSSRDSKNKTPLDYVNDRLASLRNDRTENTNTDACESLDTLIQDFSLKRKALKIFNQAKHIISRAKHLEHWESVEIIPHQLRDLQLTDEGKSHSSTDFLFCLVKIDGNKENGIPLTPFANFIDFGNVERNPKYTITYNKKLGFTLPRGEIVVSIIKGSSKTEGLNVKIGTWSETIQNIRCNAGTCEETTIEGQIKKSDFLLGGSFSMKIQKRPPENKVIRGERSEIASQLSELADWISRFQKETSGDGQDDSCLDANISVGFISELSLLHVAVYAANSKLVEHLLSLGADPNKVSEVGSAKDLAFSLADKVNCEDDAETHSTFVAIGQFLGSFVLGNESCKEHPYHEELNNSPQNEITSEESEGFTEQLCKDFRRKSQHHYIEEEVVSANGVEKSSGKAQSHSTDSRLIRYEENSQQSSISQERLSPLHQNITKQKHRDAKNSYPSYNTQDLKLTPHQSQKPPPHVTGEISRQVSPVDDQCARDFPSMQNHSNMMPQKGDLPQLSTPDWIEGRTVRCHFFNKKSGCRFGAKCKYAHCFPPVGSTLDDEKRADELFTLKNKGWNRSHVLLKEALDAHFRPWYTAAYFNRERNNILYAERGDLSHQSQQGIYWYRSKNDALKALKRVWAIITPMETIFNQTNEPNKKHNLQYPYPIQQAAKKAKHDHMDGSGWETELPHLSDISWIEGKSNKCLWFDSPGGCHHGKKCRNAHIVSSDGSISPFIRQKDKEKIFNKKFIRTKELTDPAGRRWYTAAFYNSLENIIVYAKWGHSSRLNNQGVYLYPNPEEAIKALESNVFASAKLVNTLLGHEEHSALQGPSLENDDTSNQGLFWKVIKANLNNTYMQIFHGQTLPKTCWVVSISKEGLYSAKFLSPSKDDNGAIYLPLGNGGIYKDGCWWYKDEKSAKASAFTQFLERAVERGLVSPEMTRNGQSVFK